MERPGMRQHVHSCNHAAESFVSFISFSMALAHAQLPNLDDSV
jgi:hypothetical protein